MHTDEQINTNRTLRRLLVITGRLMVVLLLLMIANQAYDLFVSLSLTDCSFG